MLLVEALNISSGGGLVLLNYLIDNLKKNKIDFLVLTSSKITIEDKRVLKFKGSYFFNRGGIIKKTIKENRISKVLFFGNYGPPVKLHIPTYVYFHRAGLIGLTTLSGLSFFKIQLSRLYLKYCLKNSDNYIFQTEYVKQIFMENYSFFKNTYILPFYFSKIFNVKINDKESDFFYPSLAYSHKNHKMLFNSWIEIAKKGFYPKLMVTIDSNNIELIRYINNSNKKYNTKIINLGVINHVESIQTMVKSKFVVFPSLSETLGLGLVEAVNSNCHVIAAKTAFLKDIIKPSVVFDSENINELTNIVIELVEKSQKIKLKQPEVIIQNKINKLIKLLN